MKHLYLPFNICLLLKEKGFNEPCIAVYTSDDGPDSKWDLNEFGDYEFPNKRFENLWNDFNKFDEYMMSAPLYQQVIDWLRSRNVKITEGKQYGWFVLQQFPESRNAWITIKEPFTLDEAIIESIKLL